MSAGRRGALDRTVDGDVAVVIDAAERPDPVELRKLRERERLPGGGAIGELLLLAEVVAIARRQPADAPVDDQVGRAQLPQLNRHLARRPGDERQPVARADGLLVTVGGEHQLAAVVAREAVVTTLGPL